MACPSVRSGPTHSQHTDASTPICTHACPSVRSGPTQSQHTDVSAPIPATQPTPHCSFTTHNKHTCKTHFQSTQNSPCSIIMPLAPRLQRSTSSSMLLPSSTFFKSVIPKLYLATVLGGMAFANTRPIAKPWLTHNNSCCP